MPVIKEDCRQHNNAQVLTACVAVQICTQIKNFCFEWVGFGSGVSDDFYGLWQVFTVSLPSVARMPFYYELKILFVLWLLSPATKGSSLLYRRFVHPQLVQREQVGVVGSDSWGHNLSGGH